MNEFFAELTNGNWEEVDSYVSANQKFVLNIDGERRYSDNKLTIVDDLIELPATVSKANLGWIARLAGVTIPVGKTERITAKPNELLLVKKGNSTFYYEVATGNKFKKVA
jgi:hypothetical protein